MLIVYIIQLTDNLEWAAEAVATFTAICTITLERNTTLWIDGMPPPGLLLLSCPNQCSGNGECVNGNKMCL